MSSSSADFEYQPQPRTIAQTKSLAELCLASIAEMSDLVLGMQPEELQRITYDKLKEKFSPVPASVSDSQLLDRFSSGDAKTVAHKLIAENILANLLFRKHPRTVINSQTSKNLHEQYDSAFHPLEVYVKQILYRQYLHRDISAVLPPGQDITGTPKAVSQTPGFFNKIKAAAKSVRGSDTFGKITLVNEFMNNLPAAHSPEELTKLTDQLQELLGNINIKVDKLACHALITDRMVAGAQMTEYRPSTPTN